MTAWGEAQKQAVRWRVSPGGAEMTAGAAAGAAADRRVGPGGKTVKRGHGG